MYRVSVRNTSTVVNKIFTDIRHHLIQCICTWMYFSLYSRCWFIFVFLFFLFLILPSACIVIHTHVRTDIDQWWTHVRRYLHDFFSQLFFFVYFHSALYGITRKGLIFLSFTAHSHGCDGLLMNIIYTIKRVQMLISNEPNYYWTWRVLYKLDGSFLISLLE